jgi:putative PIN family toxin of toxin-antitoxin system
VARHVHKAVVDTNVVISSFFGGKPREVMDSFRNGKLVLCISNEILAEYIEVLARFDSVPQGAVRDLLEAFADPDRAHFVAPQEHIEEVKADPADNMFLECAVASGAQIIISGDEHLLSLKGFRGIPILSPNEFLAAFSDA